MKMLIGRAQQARTSELNANFVSLYVCMYVCMFMSVRMRPRATRKRSRPCLFRSLRPQMLHYSCAEVGQA